MPEKDYPAALRDRCGEAAYSAIVGKSSSDLWGWDRLGPTAKALYTAAAVAVLDAAKEAGHGGTPVPVVPVVPVSKSTLFDDD